MALTPKRGQALDISASEWADMQRMLRWWKAGEAGGSGGLIPRQALFGSGVVDLVNGSGSDLGAGAVLGISGSMYDPAIDAAGFKFKVALRGVAPSDPDHRGNFAVLLEPIRSTRIGKACLCGVCPARISVESPHHRFADIENGITATLKSRVTGGAQILWRESGDSGSKNALVRVCNEGAELLVGWGMPAGATALNGSGKGHATDPTTRWSYTMVEAVAVAGGEWEAVSGGWSVTAYNSAEWRNKYVYAGSNEDKPLGNGIVFENLRDIGLFYPVPPALDTDDTDGIVAVPVYRVVTTTGTTEYRFTWPNQIDGACQ